MRVMITGAAGFIGYHLASFLLKQSVKVIAIDNFNDYYDINLKRDRQKQLMKYVDCLFYEIDIKNKDLIEDIFVKHNPTHVINLAAQAGVRYSIKNPQAYIDSNLVGFMNILEACRANPVKHLLYASSSSVYGGNRVAPFSTNHNVDHPVSLYAATKKSNELMAHSYSHLYGIPTTGLRFFTVYGPFGRPDMAYYSFTKNIIDEKSIKVFNHGNMERDFTYIDDIVEGIFRLIDKPPIAIENWSEVKDGNSTSFAPYKVYNIGNSKPIKLMKFINAIENAVGKEAKKEYINMQPGDVLRTYADVSDLERDIKFKPSTSIEEGITKFVDWYKDYYNID